tara:strand:- start:564 stop:800 length:237 start_codon:yes stop_codon:yes gene_type:complete
MTTDFFETWKNNDTLDEIIRTIIRNIRSNPEKDKNIIASDVIEDQNFYGNDASVVKAREYIFDKIYQSKGITLQWLYG